MAFVSGTLRSRADIVSDTAFHNTLQVPSDRAAEWSGADAPPRGSRRHVLTLVAGLSALAIYIGGRELIQATIGSVPLIDAALIGLSALILMSHGGVAPRLARCARRPVRRARSSGPPVACPGPLRARLAQRFSAQRASLSSLHRRGFSPTRSSASGSAPTHRTRRPSLRATRISTPISTRTAAASPVVERLAAALEMMAARREGPVLDRAPRQEAAALRVPASEATLPAAIAELAAKATACAPQLELQLSVPEIQQGAAMRESFLPNSVETGDAVAFEPPRVLRRMVD